MLHGRKICFFSPSGGYGDIDKGAWDCPALFETAQSQPQPSIVFSTL